MLCILVKRTEITITYSCRNPKLFDYILKSVYLCTSVCSSKIIHIPSHAADKKKSRTSRRNKISKYIDRYEDNYGLGSTISATHLFTKNESSENTRAEVTFSNAYNLSLPVGGWETSKAKRKRSFLRISKT